MAHHDGPLYAPRVIIVSLGCSAIMNFYRDLPSASAQLPQLGVFMRPRSMLVFEQRLFDELYHAIEPASIYSCALQLNLLVPGYP
jgi:hypothetical protein